MEINPSEVTKILKEQIKKFGDKAEISEVGQVLSWPATHEQVTEAAKLVPDDIVQMLTASGTPAEVRSAVDSYVANGCTSPVLYPLGDVYSTIDAFADWQGPT